jgi:Fungal Zn(2)-Cys(6) binuclear cluster domain
VSPSPFLLISLLFVIIPSSSPLLFVVRHVCNLLFLILRVTLTHSCLIYVRRQSQSKQPQSHFISARSNPLRLLSLLSPTGCDACRARKVRCARDNPDDSQSSCKHCITLGIPCTYDYQPKKRGPPNLYGIAASLTCSSLIPDLRSPPPQVLAPTTGSCRCRCGPTPARLPKWRGYFPSFRPAEHG